MQAEAMPAASSKSTRYRSPVIRRVVALDFSMQRVAGTLGISEQTLYRIANGKSDPDVFVADRLAKLLEWTAEDLMAALRDAKQHYRARGSKTAASANS